MDRQKVHDAVVEAFEKKYLGLGKEVADEFLMSIASWNIQEYNKPEFRVRRHLCLYWAPGWVKSTMLVKFYHILGPDLCMWASDLTLATLRGSVDSGQFVAPACLKKPFAVATEFGQIVNPDQQELVQKLLNVLEEGVVTVSLVKISQMDPIDQSRAQAEYPQLKFLDANTFTYNTNWTLFAGTYNKKFLFDNALESRFNIISPTQHLNNELVRHVNNSDPFDLDERVIFELRDLVKKKHDSKIKAKLPDEIYDSKRPITIRESAQLLSYAMCKSWWGLKVSDEELLNLADRYRTSSMDIWLSSEDKIFSVLEGGNPYTIDELVEHTRLTKKTVYVTLRKLGLNPFREPTTGKKVFCIR